MNLGSALKNAFRKIVGWTLIIFSALFFIASFALLMQGDFASSVTGFMFSLFVLATGWAIQTNVEKLRKRIQALMTRYFPQCPLCKSDKGYKVRGLLPSSQYVRCKTCGAEWTSRDFVGYKNLRALKLWKPPEDPEVYAQFISQSPLKLRKMYSTKLWKALMNKEEIQLAAKGRRTRLENVFFSHRKGVVLILVSSILILISPFLLTHNYSIGCFTVSSGASLALTLIGFHSFSLSKEKSYILFWATFIPIFFGLVRLL